MRLARAIWVGLLACTALAAAPASSRAAWLGLRNDSKTPIIVQTSTVVNNQTCPGRPLILYPGEVTWDCVVQPCIKDITICDAKTKKAIFEKKGTACGTTDVFFSIQAGTPGQMKLVPTMPPTPPPRR